MGKTKLLILAAGKGERLRPLTLGIPKGMVKIKKISLIENIIFNAEKNEIFDIDIVTGYKKSKINYKNINYIHNKFFNKTNMVYSFFLALNSYKKIDFDLIISYSDIVYNKSILKKIKNSKKNISVVVDTIWKKYWKERFETPLNDAESCIIKNNKIVEIGKPIKNFKNNKFQYIGLIKIKKNDLIKIRYKLIKIHKNKSNNIDINKDYFTDFLNYLINQKFSINPIKIKKGWLEIDTIKDYKIANNHILLKNKSLIVTR